MDISTNSVVDISTNLIKKEDLREEIKKIKREELIKMIMRQTDYDEDKVLERLKYWNYNSLFVIKEYLNPDFLKKKEEKKKISLDQRMRGEMRRFCDRGQRIYDIKKKISERMNTMKAANEKLNQGTSSPEPPINLSGGLGGSRPQL
tara:strand:+ start:419 stop:859 length:441 start_codon:yes stop_codon:yes gene_type:complete